ncbi:hypothetical protein JCGZ_14700 [Jatropha curcas]|uniref:Uncharacterized protein n=1 Tax=Jatropha curcas TaxID=180498 RepID=A0A067K8Q3_JATCU|nr:CLAVATA3/ESR (CLE)-related protein 1 [Jatropha curcas]KDP32497.1 hypothetical protein JCGZ_14700 [Jatropha curcas]
MANNSKKFLLCLFLILISFSRIETRPMPMASNQKINRSLIESTKEVLKESLRRQEMVGGFNQSLRISPGGPDPHHH